MASWRSFGKPIPPVPVSGILDHSPAVKAPKEQIRELENQGLRPSVYRVFVLLGRHLNEAAAAISTRSMRSYTGWCGSADYLMITSLKAPKASVGMTMRARTTALMAGG